MSPFPYSDAIDAPILEARKLMLEHHVRHSPVTRDHELKGIITDRDIKLLLGPELDYPNPREMTVTGHGRLAGIFTERCVPRSRRVAARTFSEGRRRCVRAETVPVVLDVPEWACQCTQDEFQEMRDAEYPLTRPDHFCRGLCA